MPIPPLPPNTVGVHDGTGNDVRMMRTFRLGEIVAYDGWLLTVTGIDHDANHGVQITFQRTGRENP